MNNLAPTMNTATTAPVELRDPVVRDLNEAIGILATSRQNATGLPARTVWEIINSAQGHLERQLREYLTGSGQGRPWHDRRR